MKTTAIDARKENIMPHRMHHSFLLSAQPTPEMPPPSSTLPPLPADPAKAVADAAKLWGLPPYATADDVCAYAEALRDAISPADDGADPTDEADAMAKLTPQQAKLAKDMGCTARDFLSLRKARDASVRSAPAALARPSTGLSEKERFALADSGCDPAEYLALRATRDAAVLKPRQDAADEFATTLLSATELAACRENGCRPADYVALKIKLNTATSSMTKTH